MNNELVNTFTPTNDHGELDCRFEQDLSIIFSEVRSEVIHGLNEFKQKTTDLENQYGSLAYELCMSFIKRMDHIDKTERDLPSYHYGWRSKKLRKQLIEGLKERGFKPSNVYKMLGAAEYVSRLRRSKDKKALAFVEAQPISFQYILSGMTHIGLGIAMDYENANRAWDPKTDTFISKPLTKKALEEIKGWHSRNQDETRGRKKSEHLKILDDDPTPTTEIVVERSKEDMSQIELVNELAQIVGLIDVSKIYKDKEIIERLSVVAEDLWSVAHLAKQPIPNK